MGLVLASVRCEDSEQSRRCPGDGLRDVLDPRRS